jgi:hypothetical protein
VRGRREALVRLGAEPRGERGADAGHREAARLDDAHVGRHLGGERLVGPCRGRARGQDEHDRKLGRLPGERMQEAQRRSVRPVRVVDHDRERVAVLRERRHQPGQSVPGRERRLGTGRRTSSVAAGPNQRGSCQTRRAAQQPVALGVPRVEHDGEQQLAGHAVRERLLERRPARRQHPQPRVAGGRDGGVEQRRLPDPGLALDEDRFATTCGDGVSERVC